MEHALLSGRVVLALAVVVGAVVLWFTTVTGGGFALGVLLLAGIAVAVWYFGVNINRRLKNLL
jgi:predicted N-acetyltransferase YhbS